MSGNDLAGLLLENLDVPLRLLSIYAVDPMFVSK